MKNIKKLLALVLALAICAAFALPALADENQPDAVGTSASEGPFDLTLKNPQAGHTYEIYQLFTGDPAKDGENWILANVEYGTSGWKMDGMEDNAAKAAEAISNYTSAEREVFLKNLANLEPYTEREGDTTESFTYKAETGEPYTWKLPGGYYVIKDITSELPAHEVASGIMVSVVGPVDVNIKPTQPTPDKDIENSDPDVINPNGYQVGSMIPYVLSAKVPAANLWEYVKPGQIKSSYELTFRDYMPPQLTYLPSEAEFNVYILGTGGTRGDSVEKEGHWSVNNTPTKKNSAGTTAAFELTLDLFSVIGVDSSMWGNYIDEEGNIVVEVTYYAMLNALEFKPSVDGEGNPIKNQVELDYPNSPESDGTGSSTSEPTDVPVYTFKIDGVKVDKENNKLAGAVFELKTSAEESDSAILFVEDGDNYIQWNSGAYSEVQNAEGENAGKYVWKKIGEKKVEGKDEYQPVYETDDSGELKTYPVVTQVTSDSNGAFSFGGLKDGTYYLHEIKAPAGYNKLDKPRKIEIIPEFNEDGKLTDVKYKLDDEEVTANEGQTVVIAIENNKGSTLPSTGGMGTTILYIVGAVLVVGAGVVLFTKRRMSN